MANDMTIMVGTVGQGIMRSPDGGDSWRRVGISQGLHSDALVRCLINVPGKTGTVFAGTDKGYIEAPTQAIPGSSLTRL